MKNRGSAILGVLIAMIVSLFVIISSVVYSGDSNSFRPLIMIVLALVLAGLGITVGSLVSAEVIKRLMIGRALFIVLTTLLLPMVGIVSFIIFTV